MVGVSHECDFPAGIPGLPILTRTRTTLPKASGAIDVAVREMLKDAIAVYEVLVDRLREANPDVIVTQDLCDVCAVSIDDVHRALKELGTGDVDIVSLKPTLLQDVWDDLRRVGVALGREAEGEAAAKDCEARVRAIGERSTAALAGAKRPTVLTIEWIDPIMIGGTWMPELAELAGGEALLAKPGVHSPTVGLDELSAIDPDVVLIKPCGFKLERTHEELDLLKQRLPWDSWSAVTKGNVYLADGNAFFNRPGPRLVESLEILAACVLPDEFGEYRIKHKDSLQRVAPDLSIVAL
ncbi:MAG: iron complex transport system substrate-binding protein [Planctomycetota bacterium]